MGKSLGDRIVIVIALAAPSCRRGCERRVSRDYLRCAARRGPVGFAVVID
jgi:hypothetical protein